MALFADSAGVAAGYLWHDCIPKYTSSRRVLLPGKGKDWDVFDRKAPDGDFFITERLLASSTTT